MKQASEFFIKAYNEGTLDRYYVSDLTIQTLNGELIEIPESDVSLKNNIFSSGGDEKGFLLGKVIVDTLQLEIENNYYKYDSVNFNNATLSCKIKCDIENEETLIETFELGDWIIITPEVNGNYITLNMARIYANYARPAWSKFTLEHEILDAKTIVQHICNYLGLNLVNYEAVSDRAKFLFASDNFYKMNDDITTCIEILEVMAYFAAGYIYIDIQGNLNTRTYSMDVLKDEVFASYWGGVFDDAENTYMSGDKLDGGLFGEEQTEVVSPQFDNLTNIIHIPAYTVFNFTHNTEYTKPTGIKYGYSGTSVNDDSITGTIKVKAPKKSGDISLKDYYKELFLTSVDNKGTDSVWVILYDENGKQLSDKEIKKNERVELYNNSYHAKKFCIHSKVQSSSGSVKLSTPNMSGAVKVNSYNKMTVTGIKDRLGRSYGNITTYMYPYGSANTQIYKKKTTKLNQEIAMDNIKDILFYKGANTSKTEKYSYSDNGSIMPIDNKTDLTINSFTNCNYVTVALLKSNNAADIISTHKITKKTHIPLTADTKYFSISIPNTNKDIKKVNYTLWYQNFTITYRLDSETRVSYKATGKVVTTSNIENTTGTSEYLLDISSLKYPAELEKQDSDAKVIAEKVLEKIKFPFLIFEADIAGNPTIEVGDIIAIPDASGKVYYSYVTNVSFEFNGYTTIKCVANEAEK